MSQRLIVNLPGVQTQLELSSGLAASIDKIPFTPADLESNQFVSATFYIPAGGKFASINPVAGTVTGLAGAIANAKLGYNMDGFSSSARAYAILLSAQAKAGATASLVNNTIKLFAGGWEIARTSVSTDTQTAGNIMLVCPAVESEASHGGNTLVALAADGTAITGGAIAASGDAYSKTSHGLSTGDRVVLNSFSGGTGGITAGQQYWFNKSSANAGLLCSSFENAVAGTAVDATGSDASSVSITKKNDLGVFLSAEDANLEISLFVLMGDS